MLIIPGAGGGGAGHELPSPFIKGIGGGGMGTLLGSDKASGGGGGGGGAGPPTEGIGGGGGGAGGAGAFFSALVGFESPLARGSVCVMVSSCWIRSSSATCRCRDSSSCCETVYLNDETSVSRRALDKHSISNKLSTNYETGSIT